MKKFTFLLIAVLSVFLLGCGYTTSSTLPARLRTIYIEHFSNKIDFAAENKRNVYLPLLEVDTRNAIINRFLFDGNVKAVKPDVASMILKGELISYDRTALRYTDDDDVLEYRIQIAVNLTLIDTALDETIWQEKGFVGQAEYFISGPDAITEAAAVENATVDLARRIVERTIENW